MDIETIKQNLLSAPWRLHKTVEVEGAHGPVTMHIRHPPNSKTRDLLTKARAEGMIDDAGRPPDEATGLRFMAQVVALTVWLPNAARPLFTPEEVLDWPGMNDVALACMEALAPPSANVERLKGN